MTKNQVNGSGLALPELPVPATRRLALRVTPAAERALRRGHPWLYAEAIRTQSHEGQPGDLAVIFDQKRDFLAIGLYDPLSPVRVRVLQARTPAPIDAAWFHRQIAAALARRAPLEADIRTTGYRLIHGENDGLPGFVVDRYGDTAVIKLYSAAWVPHLRTILPALLEQATLSRLVLRLSRALTAAPRYLHGLTPGQILAGPPLAGPVPFRENGLDFAADVVAGQKTGFFFDHRDNRARVGARAAGKEMLNVFAYSGAFSLYAARGGSPYVLSVDVSGPALAAARHNFTLNQDITTVAAAQHETMEADAFAALPSLARAGRRFALIVVDPPTFARSKQDVPGARQAYRTLTRGALDLLTPGGTLVMASCTGRIDADAFFALIEAEAAAFGRPLQDVTRTGHPLDHPVTFPEGAYLKCLFAVAP